MDRKVHTIIGIVLFALAVTVPLFFRGLYFETDLIPAVIGIGIIFAIWSGMAISRKGYRFFGDPTDYILLAIVIFYALSIVYGVNKRAAMFELFKHMVYFIVFIMAKDISRKEKYKKVVVNIVLLGGLIVSLIGIGTAIGTWEYHGAMLGNRLSSTFQYPNTLAAYVGALYFLALSMAVNEDNKYIRIIYGAMGGTFLFSLILTYSRAMWLIFPIVGLAYFLVTPNKRKLESLIYIIATAIFSIPAAFLFTRALGDAGSNMWIYYIAASVGTGLITFVLSLPVKLYRKIPIIALYIVIGLLVVGATAATFYAINSTTEIEFVNDTEKNISQSISRNVSKTLPLSDYTLELGYKAKNEVEAPYAGIVRIYNIDTDGSTAEIVRENVVESSQGILQIDFSTPEDSIGIRITLSNYYENTSIIFNEGKVIDRLNGDIEYNVPLNYKYIPEAIVSRVYSLGIGSTSADARIAFIRDGIQIVKDYPVLGAGGGGWVTLYHKYQSYPYWTTEAHNFLLQLWIELGTIGIGLFLMMFLLVTVLGIRTYFKVKDMESRLLLLGLYFALVTMLGHAAIDFDMSLPAFAIVFWAVFGSLAGRIHYPCPEAYTKFQNGTTILFSYGTLILVILILVNSFKVQTSIRHSGVGLEAIDGGDIDIGIESFVKASNLDKYNPDYYHDLTQLYMQKYMETEDMVYPQLAYEASQRFMDLSKHDATSYGSMSSFFMSVGQIDQSLDLLDRGVELQPLITNQYIHKGNGYLAVFKYYYENEEYDKAREILERGLKVKETLQAASKTTIRPLSTDMDLLYSVGELQYYLDNFDAPDLPFAWGYNLDFAYFFDLDLNNDGEVDMLKMSMSEGSNFQYEHLEDGVDSFVRLQNDGEKQGILYIHGIKMEPDREYLVQVKARGNIDEDSMNIIVLSSGAEEPTQGRLKGVPVDDEWYPYVFEFVTDTDVEPGKQQIRLQLIGNDTGYVDIKEVTIFKKDK